MISELISNSNFPKIEFLTFLVGLVGIWCGRSVRVSVCWLAGRLCYIKQTQTEGPCLLSFWTKKSKVETELIRVQTITFSIQAIGIHSSVFLKLLWKILHVETNIVPVPGSW